MQRFLSKLSESMPWLDKPARVLHDASAPLYGFDAPYAIKDFLYGTWLGHPLHPPLTDVPVGSWTVSAALDLLGEHRAADATLKLGTLGALGTAASGVAQWWDLQEMDEARRLGVLHALMNGTALGLYMASWALRDRGQRNAGVATAFAGYAMASSSAWIGGHLSFRLGIGVSNDAFTEQLEGWNDAIADTDLPEGKLTRVQIDTADLMLLRQGEEVLATAAVCTHVGGPLDQGEVVGDCVICPWHGSHFDLRNGRVIHGPATAPVDAYETRLHEGIIQIRALPG